MEQKLLLVYGDGLELAPNMQFERVFTTLEDIQDYSGHKVALVLTMMCV